ncbi:HNH endonuclease [Listeria booriae]|uniref:HNH endonuclease n=1 Tax=Listeria booriae TaxID=1552123 RepID=UPI0016254F07|nr:HNH endonuclease signature motif containing protein [Listeria booriae]MBC1983022.1 HNH endonuclease [Listeria booriae]MBC6300313.1 HNH endonuclease [Listeria booriae]
MKYCSYPACNAKVVSGLYCEEHKRRPKRKPVYSKNKSFYRTQAWIDLRTSIYIRDGGRCRECGKFVYGRDAQVHHIKPIWKNPELKLDVENVILVCAACHPKLEEKPPRSKNNFFDNWGIGSGESSFEQDGKK